MGERTKSGPRRFARFLAGLAACLALAGGAGAAQACSLAPEYAIPSNYELVQLAQAIVVATPVESAGEVDHMPAVRFRVVSVLKGPAPAEFVNTWARLGATTPSDRVRLREAHPEAYSGSCTRMTFAKGGRYVLFLERDEDGTWRQAGRPFSRVNEDYAGETSLWVRTIRAYLEIQQVHDPVGQIGALDALLRKTLAEPETPERRALAVDIADHLMARSPYKPTGYLVATYEALERGEKPRFGVWSREDGYKEISDAERFAALKAGSYGSKTWDAEELELEVLNALVIGAHPDATPLFERLLAKGRLDPERLGLAIRFLAENGQYRRAYALIEGDAMGRLGALPGEQAQRLVWDIALAQRGDSWEPEKARWRTDPYVAQAWPELALSLYWTQVGLFGAERATNFADAIAAIPLTDFRARPLLTLARAGGHDQAVRAWAMAELADEAKRRAQEARNTITDETDPANLPMQVLVLGYGDERDAALKRAFCQGGDRRFLLIYALGQWGDGLDTDLLQQMALTPGLTDDERDALGQAAARIYGRKAARRVGEAASWDGSPEYDTLKAVIRGEKLNSSLLSDKLEPVRCDA